MCIAGTGLATDEPGCGAVSQRGVAGGLELCGSGLLGCGLSAGVEGCGEQGDGSSALQSLVE